MRLLHSIDNSVISLLLLTVLIFGGVGNVETSAGEEECKDCVGFGGHTLYKNANVGRKSGWIEGQDLNQIRDAYGDCGAAINSISIDGKIKLSYKKGGPAAKTGCTFDMVSKKEFPKFSVSIPTWECVPKVNDNPSTGAKDDYANAAGMNTVPIFFNAIKPREHYYGGLCFDRFDCSDDTTKFESGCNAKISPKPRKHLCQGGCAGKWVPYEMSFAQNNGAVKFFMTEVADGEFCDHHPPSNPNKPNITVEFKNITNDGSKWDSVVYKFDDKQDIQAQPMCLGNKAKPLNKNWELHGSTNSTSGNKEYLLTVHLLPQSVLYDRSLPSANYDQLTISSEPAERDPEQYPKCDFDIEFDGKMLFGKIEDKSAPVCDPGNMPIWMIVALALAGLLIAELIAFGVWWLFVLGICGGSGSDDSDEKAAFNDNGDYYSPSVVEKGGATMTKTKTEAATTKTDAGKTKTDAEKTKTDAGKTKTEAEKTKTEAAKTKTEAEKTKTEAAKTKTEAEKTKTEAAKTKTEAGKTTAQKTTQKDVSPYSKLENKAGQQVTKHGKTTTVAVTKK